MISATTAYDRTMNNIKSNLTEEMERISKEISDAIEDGKFRIKIDKLSGITRMQLEKLGYKIDSDSEFFGTYDVISWDKI
jgi:hypothetical protein